MGTKPKSSKRPKDKTPPKYDMPDDAREKQGAGQYPNCWVRKTRSGHILKFDDSKDNECITIQHRSGAMIQFMPDGAVQYVSHNGQQNIVFGENSVLVTGAQDTTVRKDSSTVTHGECNTTVHKGMNMSCGGAYNVVADSHNAKYTKQCDVSAKSSTINTTENFTIAAGDSCTISSKGGCAIVAPESGMVMYGGKGGAGIRGESTAHIESGGPVNVQGKAFYADADEIHFNSKKSKKIVDAVTMPGPPSSDNSIIAT